MATPWDSEPSPLVSQIADQLEPKSRRRPPPDYQPADDGQGQGGGHGSGYGLPSRWAGHDSGQSQGHPKIPQPDANYTPSGPYPFCCGTCCYIVMGEVGGYCCQIVDGVVDQESTCRLYTPQVARQGLPAYQPVGSGPVLEIEVAGIGHPAAAPGHSSHPSPPPAWSIPGGQSSQPPGLPQAGIDPNYPMGD